MLPVLIRCSQLEDLYVSQDARNKGVGKALFAELGKVAQEKVTSPCFFPWILLMQPSATRTVHALIGRYSR